MTEIKIGELKFSGKGEVKDYLRRLLGSKNGGDTISRADTEVLKWALQFHLNGAEKVGVGIDFISVTYLPGPPPSKCFLITRIDGSTETFSYRTCFSSAKSDIKKAFRNEVSSLCSRVKRELAEKQKYGSLIYSEVEDDFFRLSDMALDHYPVAFSTIMNRFVELENLDLATVELIQKNRMVRLKDDKLAHRWYEYHRQHATFRLISAKLNTELGNHGG